MTFILLGISFLVFYAIGMVAYKKETFLIVKCNNSKPASDVYLHHIFSHDSYVPFSAYSEYLTSLAVKYPNLRFNVIFLQEDSPQNDYPISKHARFYSKLLPYHSNKLYDEYNKHEMTIFQKRFQNVLINVLPLSKYMANTPLKYKWKTISKTFIPFYARVYSIWQTGGVALDLSIYNHQFRRSRSIDLRIDTILKQHNNGINIDGYANALNAVNRKEETEFFISFNNMINRLINETRSIFNFSMPFSQINIGSAPNEEPLIRTHRNKRDIELTTSNITSNDKPIINLVLANTTVALEEDAKKNVYHIATDTNETSNISMPLLANQDWPLRTFDADVTNADSAKINETENKNTSFPAAGHIVMIYDLSIISDGEIPRNPGSQPQRSPTYDRVPQENSMIKTNNKHGSHRTQIVSIESGGYFMSATSAMHPFLGYIITAGCKLMPPKLAIQDALITQCSGEFSDDTYCNNIFVL